MPLERTRGCIVMLEGSVGEELFSHAKQKTYHILYIYENLVVQEKGNSRIKLLTDVQSLIK